MRSILVIPNYLDTSKVEKVYQPFLDVIYKFIKKGAYKDELQWKGIMLFLKRCKDLVDFKEFTQELPKEKMEELKSTTGIQQ